LPEVGFELQDDSGEVRSDAELAWPDQQVAVVLPDRLDAVEVSREQGWTVFVADEVTEDQLLDLLSE
jgi:DEAD/DEAH box helicase domain-containing protein